MPLTEKTIQHPRKCIKNSNTLILVNASHPLSRQNITDLTPVDDAHPKILLRREAARALKRLLEASAAKDAIIPVSGYRTMEEQEDIYEKSRKENGEEFTRKYVALPGCSEHQTGLAIDLGLNQGEIDFIRPYFPYDGICGEFRKAAPEFGFVERYGRDKEEITGIAYEPWHFRYVGTPHAEIMTKKGMALEEYTAFCLI